MLLAADLPHRRDGAILLDPLSGELSPDASRRGNPLLRRRGGL
jgi:hypothetical protein